MEGYADCVRGLDHEDAHADAPVDEDGSETFKRSFHPDAILGECIEGIGGNPTGTRIHPHDAGERFVDINMERDGLWDMEDVRMRPGEHEATVRDRWCLGLERHQFS